MMNHCVPDFGIGEDDPFSSALGFANRKIIPDSGNELAEILWQKGPVLRKFRSDDLPCPPDDVNGSAAGAGMLPHAPAPMEAAAGGEFFMGEDEMASWLHYTNGDMGGEDAGSSLQWAELDRRPVTPLPEAPGWPLQQQGSQGSALPPLPATRPPEGMNRVGASRESTVVGSNMTPGTMSTEPLPPDSRMSTMAATREGARTYENMTVTSSSGGGGGGGGSGSGSGERTAHVADDRKRKARELDDSDGEEGEYDSDDKKKDARRPTRRTRAAEVHNLSERRRRDRINEKMRALQQLIPRCNKSDKASMLDDAVEYLKSLQLQIKVMSMGCTMPPMMYAGIPQYAAQMGTATGMNTNSGCVAHPMLPFMPVMQGSPIPGPTAANLGARMPMQAFHPASMAVNGHLRGQTPDQRDPAANAMCLQGQNPMQVLNTPDYYRQFYSLQQMQLLQDAGKVPNSPEKLDSSKPSCST